MSVEIKMPKLDTISETVALTKILIPSGSFVEKDQAVCEIETFKQTSEIKSPASGNILWKFQEDDEIPVDEIIATISESAEKSQNEITKTKIEPEIKLTEKARKLVEEHKIDLNLLPKDRIVREKDILPLIQKPFSIAGTKSNEVIIYGSGGFAKIVIDILRASHLYKIHGIISTDYPVIKEFRGIPILGSDSELPKIFDAGFKKIVNTVEFDASKNHVRRSVFEKLSQIGFEFVNVIHPTAILESTVELGAGNIICAGAIVGSDARIGSNCIINAGAIVSHDCIISDHCHLASNSTLAGRVVVGENSLIGQNVSVYMDVKIGRNVVVENGCSILKNVPDNSIQHLAR